MVWEVLNASHGDAATLAETRKEEMAMSFFMDIEMHWPPPAHHHSLIHWPKTFGQWFPIVCGCASNGPAPSFGVCACGLISWRVAGR